MKTEEELRKGCGFQETYSKGSLCKEGNLCSDCSALFGCFQQGKKIMLKEVEELIDDKLSNLWKLVNSDASERTSNKVIYKGVVVVLLEDLRTKLQEKGK